VKTWDNYRVDDKHLLDWLRDSSWQMQGDWMLKMVNELDAVREHAKVCQTANELNFGKFTDYVEKAKADIEYWKGSWKRYSELYSDVKGQLLKERKLCDELANLLSQYSQLRGSPGYLQAVITVVKKHMEARA
jgi:hypothetical protein